MIIIQGFIDNWYLYLGSFVLLVVLVISVYKMIKLPRDEQINKFKGWLLWAVSIAEKELKDGTGKLKLQYVYGMAVERFPWIDSIITFNTFSKWVDEALEEMKKQLDSNPQIAKFIVNQ